MMNANVNKYIGRTVEIIYQDGKDRITQRRIYVYAADYLHVKAKCLASRSHRLFLRTRILALKPVKDHA